MIAPVGRQAIWALVTVGAAACVGGLLVDGVDAIQGINTSNVDGDIIASVVAPLMGVLALLIERKQPGHPIGAIFALALSLAGVLTLVDAWATRATVGPNPSLPLGDVALWLAAWIWVPLAMIVLACLPLVFPDGQLPSARWRWAGYAIAFQAAALSLGLALAPRRVDGFPADNPYGVEGVVGDLFAVLSAVGFVLILPCVLAAAASVAVRYRHSSGLQRLQIRWLSLAGLVAVLAFAVSYPLSVILTSVFSVTVPIAFIAVVLAVGLAVMRYRLYDVDRIISRTLVYAVLTVVLGSAYAGLVIAGQALFASFAGGSNLAIASSTLVVAAVFLPVRSRVQRVVDRRFYRRRYDAQRTLEAFGARLREQVELDSLSGELVGVVVETMQPAHTALWLRGDTDR